MSKLDGLTYVKKAPIPSTARGASPVEKARKKLLSEIDHQVKLAADPDYQIEKQNRSGNITRRKPKSWIVIDGDDAFITVRYANIAMPLGGKRGSVIRCSVDAIGDTLGTVREAVATGEVDELIGKMINRAKRKPRSKTTGVSPPPPQTIHDSPVQ